MKNTPLKAIEILRNFDCTQKIRVLEVQPNETEEIHFEGSIFNCPWYIGDMLVDTSFNGEGLCILTENDKVILVMYVRDEED